MDRLRKRGFTLVELLVVIAIIGTLIGLLLPGVQAARESSRRSSCSNNAKQIALGLHSFHDAKNILPQACVLPVSGAAGNMGWGWTVFVLPFMEYGGTYDALKVSTSYPEWGTGSKTAADAAIASLICPSCQVGLLEPAAKITTLMGWGDIHSSKTNYLGNGGPTMTTAGTSSERQQASLGAIRKEKGIAFKDVTDGLSKTILIGEGGGKATSSANDPLMPSIWVCTTDNNGWMTQMLRYGATKINAGSSTSFGSYHPGGATVAMCDGSVRFISDRVEFIAGALSGGYTLTGGALAGLLSEYKSDSRGVFQKLMARDDGNSISDF